MRSNRIVTVLFLSMAACMGAAPSGGGGGSTGGNTGGDTGGSTGGDTGGSAGGSTGSSSQQITTADQFLTASEDGDCKEAFTCMSSFVPAGSGDTFADDWGTSLSDCENDSDYNTQVEADITSGIITFNAADANACISGTVYPTSCATWWSDGADYPDACDTALKGSVADGGKCNVDEDCSNLDSYCTDAGTCGSDTAAPAVRRAVRSARRR